MRWATALALLVVAACGEAPPTGQASPARTDPSRSPTATAPSPTTTSPTAPSPTSSATTAMPEMPGEVSLPAGFEIAVFAEGLNDPRMMAIGPDGQLYVAERGAGRVVRLADRDGDGVADDEDVVADGFERPSSIAFFQDGSLYVAETGQVLRMSEPDADGVFERRDIVIDDLPRGSGGHTTRTLQFSPGWSSLYISVGSGCNACVDDDERRATILRYAPDGTGGTIFARGLRNAVGLAIRPGSDELWATNNGRDLLGEDEPPETVHFIREDDDVGWPGCHAGDLVDPEFGGAEACDGVRPPEVRMQAHSAPLGLEFYTGARFPEAYRGDLFVAFHGSWDRSEPTGYKVVRIPMDGATAGEAEDFATGWRPDDEDAWGRPVDLVIAPDGSLLLSDDAGGRIYRITYE